MALQLVSSHFLTSKFILTQEIPKLLIRKVKGGVRAIPVILKPCAWQQITWLGEIQCRPTDGVPLPVKRKNDAEAVTADLAQEVLKLACVS